VLLQFSHAAINGNRPESSYGLPIAPADSTWPSALKGAVASGYDANIHGGPSYLFSGDRIRQRTNGAFGLNSAGRRAISMAPLSA